MSLVTQQINIMSLLDMMDLSGHSITSMVFLSKMHNIRLTIKKYQKNKLKDILQKKWTVFSKNIKVIKGKKWQWDSHRLKKTKETWYLNATNDLGPEKEH